MKVNRLQTFVFRRRDLLMQFFINYPHIDMYISVGVKVCFSSKKEFGRFFYRFNRPVEELDPTGDPTGLHF